MSKFCPSCGEELPNNSKFCKNCGKNLKTMEDNPYVNQSQNTEYTSPSFEGKSIVLIVLGYILSIFISLLGLIVGFYLWSRDDSSLSKHGKYIIIISLALIFIKFFLRI